MTTHETALNDTPRLATAADVALLAELFCSGADEIKLVPEACSQASRPRLESKFREDCAERLVWILESAGEIQGMLVMSSDPHEIRYVVTNKKFKRLGIGCRLIEHVKGISEVLRADAHNKNSEGMLKKCGFNNSGRKSRPKYPPGAEYPVYEWRREPR